MSTRILLIASGLFMLALGLAASLFPQEVLFYTGMQPTNLGILLVQTAGALYAGFGVVNWAARGNLLGWGYNRPLALGNFLHFTMMTVALVKALVAGLAESDRGGLRRALPAVRRLVRTRPGRPLRTGPAPPADLGWSGGVILRGWMMRRLAVRAASSDCPSGTRQPAG